MAEKKCTSYIINYSFLSFPEEVYISSLILIIFLQFPEYFVCPSWMEGNLEAGVKKRRFLPGAGYTGAMISWSVWGKKEDGKVYFEDNVELVERWYRREGTVKNAALKKFVFQGETLEKVERKTECVYNRKEWNGMNTLLLLLFPFDRADFFL